ncbi:MAG TPA: Hsp33 family molecular chaperone HslO [Myxococcota bacterium]|nr:Hsp33 family molecular chaperone HslO [Myxococcota bacterium]
MRTLSADGGLAVRALVATELVREAAERHRTAPTASAALGRALMGAVLLGAGADEGETVQLQFRGDGPLGPITAISDHLGRARGYVANPAAHPPPVGGKLDVGTAVGQGALAVVRYHPSWREPYTGIVPLVSGEIAEDIAHYLAVSEQTPSVFAAGVFVESDGTVSAAGAYLVQTLPGVDESVVAHLEATVRALPPPTALVRSGVAADGLVDALLAGLGARARTRSQPRFYCACSTEKIRRVVALLGRGERREIASGREPLEVRCEFCAAEYRLAPDEVGALLPDA